MDVRKVLFISQEISPYLPESPMGEMGRLLPQGIQERGAEVRTFMPKYGVITERRNQLHEVIRLSGLNIIIDDTDHPLIIKVATLQSARIQVYFIYNEDYFAHSLAKEMETLSSPSDNDERSIFYVRGVIETVRKLRWIPDIIQCSGWISALAPFYIRTIYSDDPSFRDAKIVTGLYDEQLPAPLDANLAAKMRQDGIPATPLKPYQGKAMDYTDLMSLSLRYTDAVIAMSATADPALLKQVSDAGKPVLDYSEGEERVQQIYDFYRSL